MKWVLVRKFLDHLNNRHGNIQFTVEAEKEGSLPMMDVLLHHEEDGKVSVSIYRKLTHTERYLSFSFHHPLSMKKSVMISLLHRVDYVS